MRLIGNLAIAAFFGAEKKKDREELRSRYETKVRNFIAVAKQGDGTTAKQELHSLVLETLEGTKPIHPFHWQIEFPEVLDTVNHGFDSIVGNPPFAGVVQAASAHSDRYTDYLRATTPRTGGKSDLVAFFFRRAYEVIRSPGTFGLVATNTVAQGDTRDSGLANICESGGHIFSVTRRIRWPGTSAVVVSTIFVSKDRVVAHATIDGREVECITAFLFSAGGNRNPAKLHQPHVGLSTKGVIPYGMGFVFEDDQDRCSPLSEMRAIIASNSKNSRRIHRFVGGADLNAHPRQTPDRFIIDLNDLEEHELGAWPELVRVVKGFVRPGRLALTSQSGADVLKQYWWRYGYNASELRAATKSLHRVLVTAQTSKYRVFSFCPADWIFDQKVVVCANDEYQFFSVIQSRVHESWSLFFGSSMKDDPVYTPSDCFETFPFPEGWYQSPSLESRGRAYYDFRAALMVRNNEGLTDTYNRFHDPEKRDPQIIEMRKLHDAMDRAVLDAYGWTDLKPTCEFILDYEEEEDDSGKPQRKKKPWRYRWPDEFRDEVLARLLALNQERAAEEKAMGVAANGPKKKGSRAGRKPRDSRTTTFLE